MKLAALATSMLLACQAHAAVPVPKLKPPFIPWWAAASSTRCGPTSDLLTLTRKENMRPIYWAPIARFAVAQLWGSQNSMAHPWMLVVHLGNGVSCMVRRGAGLPAWAAQPDGARA